MRILRLTKSAPFLIELIFCALFVIGTAPTLAADDRLPHGMVYLRDIAPTIERNMRYAGTANFTGQRVPGYRANACILARPVAKALARVQASLTSAGLSLRVFDCYRPRRAVRSFMRWVRRRSGQPYEKSFHPRIPKNELVARGYIAARSSHSLGTAVDLTLVRRRPSATSSITRPPDAQHGPVAPCHLSKAPPETVRELAMGTTWDCFDRRSWTQSGAITGRARRNRRTLVKAMAAQGFRNYRKEWWHFSRPATGFTRAYDFTVK